MKIGDMEDSVQGIVAGVLEKVDEVWTCPK